jgi:hypothetical protein
MRQPPAGWHTLTPLPRSTHRREQQFDPPVQGVPPWSQLPAAPPVAFVQRPGFGAVASQSPEQQSSPR